jgi:hypothetical protein
VVSEGSNTEYAVFEVTLVFDPRRHILPFCIKIDYVCGSSTTERVTTSQEHCLNSPAKKS